MKKLLSLLGGVSLVATSSATVVACGNTTTPKPEITDYNKLIKDFQKDVNDIFVDHFQNNVYKNLIGLTMNEKESKFLNRNTIRTFKGMSAREIGEENLVHLVDDINRILDVKDLEFKLNKLKLVNEYNILLNDVNTLYKGIVFDWNTLDISTNENEDLYLANVLLDYKIEVQYKGEKEIEIITISESLKYTLTNELVLKDSSDKFYQNITKDYFSSQESDVKKYSNLLWNDIKGGKSKLDGYGKIDKEINNYWNNTAQQNGFTDSMTEFIKTNYFKELPTLPLSFQKDNFYSGSELDRTSLFNSINNPKAYINEESIKFNYRSEEGKLMLESIFRRNPDINPTKFILKNNYFTEKNLSVWTKDYRVLKESFIERLNGNLEEIEKTKEYKSSFTMGYVNLIGPSINFPEDKYVHYLPDFKIAINYIIGLNQTSDEILNDMNDFSINSIKAFHKIYGVDYDYDYVAKNNSKEDILMAIKKSEFTEAIKFKKEDNGGIGEFNAALSLFGENTYYSYRQQLLELSNLPLNSTYLFDTREYRVNTNLPVRNSTSKYFRNYDIDRGIYLTIYNLNDKSLEERMIYWNLGYLNFHFDIDEIIGGVRTLPEKDFIVFS